MHRAWHADDKRYSNLLFVGRATVIQASVLPKLFAVVGCNRHHHITLKELLYRRPEPLHLLVDTKNFAVVTFDIRVTEGGRTVGFMYIKVVDPKEARGLTVLSHLSVCRDDIIGQLVCGPMR